MRGYWKSLGSAACLAVLLAVDSAAGAPGIMTSIQPGRVRVGSAATLSIKISGAASAEPSDIPAVDGCEIVFSGTRRSFEFINGRTWSGITLTYSVVPGRPGTFTIPPLTFHAGGDTLMSKPVQLIAYGGDAAPGRTGMLLRAEVSVSKQRVYAGEPVILRYFLLHAGAELAGKPVFEKLPEAAGALLKQLDEAWQEEAAGDSVRTHIATFAVIPAGKESITAGGGVVAVSVMDSDGFFSFPRGRRIECPVRTISVIPLPPAGRPAGYEGDVGSFTLHAAYGREPVKVFDEKRVTVTLKGRGNLVSPSMPRLEGDGVKILGEAGALSLGPPGESLDGSKEFAFTIIPEKPGKIILGGFTLTYFDPYLGRYATARSEEIRLEVRDDPSRRRGIGFEKDETTGDGIGAYLIIIAAAVFFVGGAVFLVAWWEKNRIRALAGTRDPAGQQPAETAAADDPETCMRDMRAALRRSDPERFLRAAGKMLQAVQKRSGPAGETVDGTAAALENLRSQIYRFRYGGGIAAQDDLEEIYSMLKKIHDRTAAPGGP